MTATQPATHKERRQSPRFTVKQNTMAFNDTTFGDIINISKGGLRMKFLLHRNDNFTPSFQIGLLSSTGDYYLDNLPCKVVSMKDSSPLLPSRSTYICEAGIMFHDLTADQQAKLSLFLKQNSRPMESPPCQHNQ